MSKSEWKKKPVLENHGPQKKVERKITRRDFIQYSTLALVAAALPVPLIACGGGGGGSGSGGDNSNPPASLTLDRSTAAPGDILWIARSDSPGTSNIPEDAFSVSILVDQDCAYNLRPIFFRDSWIGILLPPMIQSDGSYFKSKNVTVSLSVLGTSAGSAALSINQDLEGKTSTGTLRSLFEDVLSELSSIENDKGILFEDAPSLSKWNEIYPLAMDAIYYLLGVIAGAAPQVQTEMISGDSYVVTLPDLAVAELMISSFAENEPIPNAFWDNMPETGGLAVKKLTALLSYTVPGAFLTITRNLEGIASGTGAIADILAAAVPAAFMCVAGNCLRMLKSSQMSQENLIAGINWFANVLVSQGLCAINDRMICDFTADQDDSAYIVTQGGIDFLENVCQSFWQQTSWSNSTPWSNGAPWNNSSPWSNLIWTNQPWNHIPWNNTAIWNNNIWNNNIWSHTPWNNTPVWSNNPVWGNTPWSNTPWGNTPWSNWSNTPWSNFVNSGTPAGLRF